MCEVVPLSGTISSPVTGDITESGDMEQRTISMQCQATLMNFRIVPSGAIQSKGLRRQLITR